MTWKTEKTKDGYYINTGDDLIYCASGLIETKESDLGFQFSHEYATVLHAHRCHI